MTIVKNIHVSTFETKKEELVLTIMCWKDGVPIVEPNQKIIGTTSSQLRERLVSQINASHTSCIIINFARVDKIDSSGLGALVSAYIVAKRKKGRIGIVNVGRNLKSLIVQSWLLDTFEYFKDEDTAVAALSVSH